GMPNRRVWEEELARELERARRMGTGVCVAMIDLDNFKSYNDSFGHQAGDLVLKEAASAWRAEVRSPDLLARYGGGDVVLLLPACALEDAIRIVERLRLVTPLVTCSVGLACWDLPEAGDRRRRRCAPGQPRRAPRPGPVRRQGRGPHPPRPRLTRPRMRLPLGEVRQLANGALQAPRLDGVGGDELEEQPRCRHPEGSAQLLQLEAPDQRVLQPTGDRDREGVGPLGVVDGRSQAETR